MELSQDQVTQLLDQIRMVQPDRLDCDGCFKHMAEFADAELLGREMSDVLGDVRRHMEMCECCQEEYELLLDGLRALAD